MNRGIVTHRVRHAPRVELRRSAVEQTRPLGIFVVEEPGGDDRANGLASPVFRVSQDEVDRRLLRRLRWASRLRRRLLAVAGVGR